MGVDSIISCWLGAWMLVFKFLFGGVQGAWMLALKSCHGGEPGVYMLSHKSSSNGAWMLVFNPFLCGRGACILALKPCLVGEGGGWRYWKLALELCLLTWRCDEGSKEAASELRDPKENDLMKWLLVNCQDFFQKMAIRTFLLVILFLTRAAPQIGKVWERASA